MLALVESETPTIKLLRVEEDGATVYQTEDRLYRLWFDDRFSRPWRWARRSWKDDGVGLQHHGGARSLEAAVMACRKHKQLYGSV